MDASLRALIDRDAIRSLALQYAHAIDHRDFAGLRQVFTEDAVLIHPYGESPGIEAILQAMQGLGRYRATLHAVHNHLSWLEGDRATAETCCVAMHFLPVEDGELQQDMGIRYRDELVRTPAGWRITRRALELIWTDERPVNPMSR